LRAAGGGGSSAGGTGGTDGGKGSHGGGFGGSFGGFGGFNLGAPCVQPGGFVCVRAGFASGGGINPII
jgi:eukaryotic translation initiation factor 2C